MKTNPKGECVMLPWFKNARCNCKIGLNDDIMQMGTLSQWLAIL